MTRPGLWCQMWAWGFPVLLALVAASVLSPTVQGQEAGQDQATRPLQPSDIFELKTVGDPRVSPDGARVAYTVSSFDQKEDSSDTDVYMVSTSGGAPIRLTASKKPETSPRWSPDGHALQGGDFRRERVQTISPTTAPITISVSGRQSSACRGRRRSSGLSCRRFIAYIRSSRRRS